MLRPLIVQLESATKPLRSFCVCHAVSGVKLARSITSERTISMILARRSSSLMSRSTTSPLPLLWAAQTRAARTARIEITVDKLASSDMPPPNGTIQISGNKLGDVNITITGSTILVKPEAGQRKYFTWDDMVQKLTNAGLSGLWKRLFPEDKRDPISGLWKRLFLEDKRDPEDTL